MNFTVTKIALGHFPPLLLMGLRFASVSLVLLPYLRKPVMAWKPLILMSCTYGMGYHGLAFSGLWYGVQAAVGIIAVQTQVPFTALLGMLILKDHVGWRRFTGMVIAFSGIVIVAGTPNVLENTAGFALIVVAAFLWASYNIQLKKWGMPAVLPFLAWFSFLTAPQFFLLSLLFESNQWQLITTIPVSAALAIAYTVVFTTIIGLGTWSYLIQHYSVHQVSPFSMLAPIFGVLSAVLMLGERLTSQALFGGLITISGVAIIVLRRPEMIVKNTLLE